MEAVVMPSGDTELRSSSPTAEHLNGDMNGSSAGEEADSSMEAGSTESPPAKKVRLNDKAGGDRVVSAKAVSDSGRNTKSPVVVELSSDVDSPVKKSERINSVKRKIVDTKTNDSNNSVSECESSGNDEKTNKEKHRNGDIDAESSKKHDNSDVSLSESDSSSKTSNKKNKQVDGSENGDDVMEVEEAKEKGSESDIEEIKNDNDIKEINDDDVVEEIATKKKPSSEDPLEDDSSKKNGDDASSSEDRKSDTDAEKTQASTPTSSPDKQKIAEARRKSAEAKRQALLNITPRRSSRNLNKQKKYIDGEPEPDEPDIEEILPVDPLAVSASERVKFSEKDPLSATTPEKEPVAKVRRKNTIIVNDTKALAQIAASSKDGKKEPTLVIIDTNSILSGRGPVPVNANPPSLPAALPAQGIYPVMHPNITQHTPSPPKPQPPPPAPKPKGPIGLTDDMYVVEAPSFIVPYVYEKPPKEPLKEVVEKMGKILREQDKKDREERQRKRKEKEEKEKRDKEEKEKKEKDDKEKQDEKEGKEKEEAKEGDDKASAKKGKEGEEEEAMDVDQDSPSKTAVKDKDAAAEVSDKEEEEEPKADHDSDYKADSVKDKDSEDEDIEYDSESDSSTSDPAATKPKASSYFDSPLGKFFMQIGVNLVQEHVQTDLLRMQKRKLSKGGANNPETQLAVHSLLKNLEQSKENNKPYKFQLHKCKFCNFKTESNIVLAHHLEIPHLRNFMYHCNFCPVALRTNHDILFHMEAEHNINGRIERAPAFHQCPNCPFEDNQKSKMTRHALSCTKRFRPEKNCEPPLDWEPPAKIPRMAKSRPSNLLPNSPTASQYLAQQRAQSLQQHPLLPKLPATSMMPSLMSGAVRGRGRPSVTSRFLPDLKAMPRAIAPSQLRQAGMMYQPSSSRQQQVLVPTSYQIAGNQIYQRWSQQVVSGQNQVLPTMPRLTLMPHTGSSVALMPNISGGSNSITIQSASSKSPAAKLLQQPSISITPLPRQPSSSSSSSAASFSHPGGKQGQQVGGKNSFVICEICDGYIKDLEQLRNHMQWIHKVKIHPKMIYNRPPLNCQKCQFRFFTDQGLERHLLGSHGLVTSSMQEASNKGKDGGRCPVCGRVYQWKLLNHVAKDHNMTLKPAHLSYKCTVCTATFGMYKQFENHVYSAHSVVAKRVMDKKATANASASRSYNAAESLLKPLKINDEITIIPQPAKPSSSSSSRGGSHRKAVCQADDSGSEASL